MNKNLNFPVKQIISGALHYFRVHPGLWHDRLDKAVAMGLNTIETYVPWNLHEPHPGEFCFDGICDLEHFLQLVAEHQLYVIVRPGPYICSEWDNGGIPGWVNGLPGVKLRQFNAPYLQAVKAYFDVLLPKLKPFELSNGGPLIMLQIENEYGSFGNDKKYLRYLQELFDQAGFTVPYFTSDGPYGLCPVGGTLPDVWATANFGMNVEQAFAALHKFRPGEPECCMEFWDGWFDHWGEKHQHRPAADGGEAFAQEYEKLIARGAHSNLYMFHGGTNFGFTAGANGNTPEEYAPIVTSYDYDCPLSECGDPTEKFTECQKILRKYTANSRIRPVQPSKKIVPSPVALTASCALTEQIDQLATGQGTASAPPTFEELGENFGFVHYETMIPPFEGKATLRFYEINDYAQIWLDGQYQGGFYRPRRELCFEIVGRPEGIKLEILVENLGRINYGPYFGREFKGIAGAVTLNNQHLFQWHYAVLPCGDLSHLAWTPGLADLPATFYRGNFDLAEIGEAFLRRPGCKGCAWLNGFALGRYWDKGPTETLYIPSSVLKLQGNELVILEQEKLSEPAVNFAAEQLLGLLAE